MIGILSGQKWPEFDKNYIIDELASIVIQVNGKKRAVIEIENDAEQDEVLRQLQTIKNIQIPDDLSNIRKIIFVKNKILNLVL
jgi:leucyl-tRNA synthetase